MNSIGSSKEEMDVDPDPLEAQEGSWRSLSILPCTTEVERSNPEYANLLYERALSENTGSYKLWHAYLLHRTRQLEGKQLDDRMYEEVNNCFERALVFMHKMPRIWIEYCTLLDRQLLITRTRRTFNRALEALPITQHSRIWPLYLNFIKRDHVPVETAVRIFSRYMQLQPEDAENFIDYLHVNNRIDEAAALLCDVINRPNFQSKRDKNKYQLWEELCDMICEYADQIHTINADAVLRDGIARYHDQQGRLWNSLARYYVHLGMFSSARNIYDEAIHQVTTKKDFLEVWEAYTNFEEKYIEHLLSQEDLTEDQMLELEMRQALLEELITNNGLLLNRVALRQNPHNVREWQKRVQLCEQVDNPKRAKEETFMEALQAVDPKQALGNYEELWIEYATFYADSGSIERARDIFERATEAKFVKAEELANVWCAYIEFELRLKSDRALKLAKRSTATSKNLRTWLLYADLEENFGNFNSTKAVYDRILELKIATPQVILNYASFLENKQYYEESFRVFERGVNLFKWPNSFNIWNTYLNRFLSRYGHKKLDRARNLLEQCLKDCPAKYAFEIYLLYAKLEEESGLLSRAHSVYMEAVQRVETKRKADLFKIFIRSMMKLVELSKVREIYEHAIASLDNKSARNFCLEYASLEEDLGEIDRARTIYAYCSQMCDPRVDKEFWKLWTDFEQKFGALETIDEMLRVKRSIEALFSRPETGCLVQLAKLQDSEWFYISPPLGSIKSDVAYLDSLETFQNVNWTHSIIRIKYQIIMEDFSEYLKLRNNCDPDDPLLSSTSLGQRLNQIPLDHVNPSEFTDLTQALNLEQLIPTEGGLARDYRGMAELMGYKSSEIETRFKRFYNPTKSLIDAFISKNRSLNGNCHVTLNDLLKYIELIERFDVIDDFMPTLLKLASTHHQYQRALTSINSRGASNHEAANPILVNDFNRLTVDDTPFHENRYHAFLCYAPEDIQHAQELMSILEQRGKKLATADDLLPGNFEHDALIKLIDSRCKKVIIVLTPNFSRSKECEFQTKFANEIGIKEGSPKIIPVLFEPCKDSELPSMVRVLSKIDMTSHGSYRSMQVQRLIKSLDLSPTGSMQDIRGNPMWSQHNQIAITIESSNRVNESQNYILPVISYPDDCSRTDTNSESNGVPVIELLQSQNSEAIGMNLPIASLGSSSRTSTLDNRSTASSSNQSISKPIAWLKNLTRKVLRNEASPSIETMCANTSSQALLITTSSGRFQNDEDVG